MTTLPRAAVITPQSSGKAAQIFTTRPKSYYSRAGQVPLTPANVQIDPVSGLALVTVNFKTAVQDTNWVPLGFTFTNYQDALVDIVFLQAISVLNQSQGGFKVLLSAYPPTPNYILNWGIAEIFNP